MSEPNPERSELATAIYELISELRGNSHDHQWDILGVNEPEPAPPGRPRHPLAPFARPATLVLAGCTICQARDIWELEGTWTEEQVRGARHAASTPA
jgi:hypothetical protein